LRPAVEAIFEMGKSKGLAAITARAFLTAVLAIGAASITLADDDGHGGGEDKVLYIWAQDQALMFTATYAASAATMKYFAPPEKGKGMITSPSVPPADTPPICSP
jgi:hypothetical protein